MAQSSDVALHDTLVRDAANADVPAEVLIVMMAERHRETMGRLIEAESGRPQHITIKCNDDEFRVAQRAFGIDPGESR